MKDIEQSYSQHITQLLDFYQQLMVSNQYQGMVIPSGIPGYQFLDDNHYPFKVNVHFKALVPLTQVPHSYIVIPATGKPTLIYFQPEDYWHVVPEDPNGYWTEHFEIKLVNNTEQWLRLLPGDVSQFAWIGEQEADAQSLAFKAINPDELLHPIHYRRAIKSDYEIECMREAAKLGAKGHLAAEAAFRAGGSELEIHLAYLAAVGCKEVELPYTNIIGLNEHGAVLHYTDLATTKFAEADRKSFLIDAGADYAGYYSDITRTYAYHDDEFAKMVDDFDGLQLAIIDELKAGVDYVELHKLTHQKIAEFMVDYNLLYGDPTLAVEQGITSTFFPHGLGHFIGLQVHDIGGHQASPTGGRVEPPKAHPFLRLTRKLEAGHVITIEPGLYFIDILLNKLKSSAYAERINWQKVEQFKPYGGIRIEDDVLILEDGYENLSRAGFMAAS
jgi:Xaa-Pro dipeptidase